MTAAPPPRDSALDAMGFAFGVLRKPGFLWAPMVFTALMMLLLVALPPAGTPPGFRPPPEFGAPPQPPFATQAEFDAYVATLIPTLVASMALLIVLGPIAGAVINRLGLQYVEGERARPFAPGIVDLAWRYLLQTLAMVVLVVLGLLAVVLITALSTAVLGAGVGILVAVFLGVVFIAVVGLRLGLAPILLLWGAGPIDAIDRSWALTRGHVTRVLRWFVVVGMLVGFLSVAISGVVSAAFAAVGLTLVGQVAAGIVVAPLGLMQAIGFVQLVRLLQNPIPPAPPAAALPAWMRAGDASGGASAPPADRGE